MAPRLGFKFVREMVNIDDIRYLVIRVIQASPWTASRARTRARLDVTRMINSKKQERFICDNFIITDDQ